MRFAVVGAGAIGGYVGACLARAGTEVTLIARDAHLAAIREHGIRLLSPDGDFLTHPRATDDMAAAADADVVFLYELLIPCPTTTADGSRCAGRFALADLLALREGGQFNTIPCLKCRQALSLSELLTGFTAPDQFRGQLDRIEGTVEKLERYAAENANIVRRILRAASAEVSDCPRLFTMVPDHPSAVRRARVYQRHYRLTLWCEHPGCWHPWPRASYQLDVHQDWFARIAPYAALVVRTLQLAVPLAGNLAAVALPSDQLARVQVDLQLMGTLVADLPSKPGQDLASTAIGQTSSGLTEAEGESLRALRIILFQFDKLQAFGGLRRVQAPSGDFLWVCAEHYRDYDPGLPILS